MASKDLDMTALENHDEQDRLYGNGVHIGKDIDDQIRSFDQGIV